MSKIERITKEKILGIKSYKSKKEKIFNIGLRILVFVFVLVSLTYLSFRNVKNHEVKANPGCTGGVYNYNCCASSGGSQDCWAYYGKDKYTSVPVDKTRANWTVAGTEFASGDYTAISSSNDAWKSDSETTNIRQVVHDFVMHITETPSSISSLTLKWEGHAALGSEAAADNDLRMYVLDVNASPNAWVLLNDTTCANNACPTNDVTITSIITSNITHYIDGSGNVRFMVQKYEGKCAGTDASCYANADGTCQACGTCSTCSAGSCVAKADTNWGAGGTGCSNSNQRCYGGACRTCSGAGMYFASDNCSNCAGQGGNVCWRESAVANASCTSACTSYGGCVAANWNDTGTQACTVCIHFHSGMGCSAGTGTYYPEYHVGMMTNCAYRSSGNQDCTAVPTGIGTDGYRECVCQY